MNFWILTCCCYALEYKPHLDPTPRFFSSAAVRISLGLPIWPVIAAWLVLTAPVLLPFPFPVSALALKNPEVPQLDDYGLPPPAAFWSSIPHRPLTAKAVSPVNGPALLARVDASWVSLMPSAHSPTGCPQINLRRFSLPELSPSSYPHGTQHSCSH